MLPLLTIAGLMIGWNLLVGARREEEEEEKDTAEGSAVRVTRPMIARNQTTMVVVQSLFALRLFPLLSAGRTSKENEKESLYVVIDEDHY